MDFDDGNLAISDFTTVIDLLLNGDTTDNDADDVNNDGTVTIADVIILIDMLLSGS